MDAPANWRDFTIEQRFELLFTQLPPADMDALVDVLERHLVARIRQRGELAQAVEELQQRRYFNAPQFGVRRQ